MILCSDELHDLVLRAKQEKGLSKVHFQKHGQHFDSSEFPVFTRYNIDRLRFSFLKSAGNLEQSSKLIRRSNTATSTQVEDEPLHGFERQYAESGVPGNLADLLLAWSFEWHLTTLRVGSVENFPTTGSISAVIDQGQEERLANYAARGEDIATSDMW